MHLRYRFRIYPDAAQRLALARAFGCARVVFNDGLRMRRQAWEQGLPFVTNSELSKQVITVAKKTPERAWLSEVSTAVLQQALGDLNEAYRNFFGSVSGKHKGQKMAPPRFRSRKDSRQAIRFTKNTRFKILDNGRLRLLKVGDVAVRWSRSLPSEPTSVTIIRDAAGRYFASFVVQTAGNDILPPLATEVGIDLGLTHFAVLSDGTKITAPKFLRRAARKLRRLQQSLARKQPGSANRKKAVVKVARAHARVADSRRDWQHKLSTTIIRDNQAVYVEDLCVAGIGRTRLAKSVHDAGWANFTTMLEYKAARHGRTFAKIDRFFPSTRQCSACGLVGEKIPLSTRTWNCVCGTSHDRDINAALNILAAGRADRLNGRGASVSPVSVPAARGEAEIRSGAVQIVRRAGNPRPSGGENVKPSITTFEQHGDTSQLESHPVRKAGDDAHAGQQAVGNRSGQADDRWMDATPLPLSLLDLAPIAPGHDVRESFQASVELARAAERSGYRRVWFAEHHNMASIASSATSVLIGYIAAHTDTIRLGAGGIMLPNHSPLVIAEQFGTLATLFPGRIDLGLGRAPGSDQNTMLALRRNPMSADTFPQDVQELLGYLSGKTLVPGVQAVPRAPEIVPLYILGSSLFGAQLAAQLGLPYAFASHFAPTHLHQAVEVYRETFQPSAQLEHPYVIAGANVFAADDHDVAEQQMKVAYRARTRAMISRGSVGQNFTDAEIDAFLASPNGRQLAAMTKYTATGTPGEVRAYLEDFAASCGADELIVAHYANDVADRVRSVELTGQAMIKAGTPAS
ncbi:MsnO8 family LLM class oxidoreductase [Actinoplanes friuliensis]|uniref:Transposase, IS605 OrfB family protein n=1 Tax=Actinoplanes friuliensis DSM 7358 TaxID=1246995 RepID=U5W4V7_9ACTN|nr:MsnO8 family LLM class oxidoreductase [Actinoplanes friuliensis]AGZ44238.1 transposase, IS605 OrfB family protein [Actinoplanes friuliensis DSM 7358]